MLTLSSRATARSAKCLALGYTSDWSVPPIAQAEQTGGMPGETRREIGRLEGQPSEVLERFPDPFGAHLFALNTGLQIRLDKSPARPAAPAPEAGSAATSGRNAVATHAAIARAASHWVLNTADMSHS